MLPHKNHVYCLYRLCVPAGGYAAELNEITFTFTGNPGHLYNLQEWADTQVRHCLHASTAACMHTCLLGLACLPLVALS